MARDDWTSGDQVANIPELLTAILALLPPKDILVCRAAAKIFDQTYRSSNHLRTITFASARPDKAVPIEERGYWESTTGINVNPLLFRVAPRPVLPAFPIPVGTPVPRRPHRQFSWRGAAEVRSAVFPIRMNIFKDGRESPISLKVGFSQTATDALRNGDVGVEESWAPLYVAYPIMETRMQMSFHVGKTTHKHPTNHNLFIKISLNSSPTMGQLLLLAHLLLQIYRIKGEGHQITGLQQGKYGMEEKDMESGARGHWAGHAMARVIRSMGRKESEVAELIAGDVKVEFSEQFDKEVDYEAQCRALTKKIRRESALMG